MKFFNKYTSVLALSTTLIFNSCGSDFLDTTPTATITEERVEELADMTPLVSGLYSSLIAYDVLGRGAAGLQARHSDFGYFSIVLASDLMVDDMLQYSSSYGWYYNWYDFSLRKETSSVDVQMPWLFFYKEIKAANSIIKSVGYGEDLDAEQIAYRGQALGARAFCYYNLANLYGDAYGINKESMGVPIVTENTTNEEMANNPRASVDKIYNDIILKDLLQAEKDLANFTRTSKDVININVIYGLLARTYLMMENGEKAAEYAKKARVGYPLMDNDQLYWQNVEGKTASFSQINNVEWIWGCNVTEKSRIATSGIVNFPSHMSSVSYGYVEAGQMYKCIDANLYGNIPVSDARKKAWLAESTDIYGKTVPMYANIKFGRMNPANNNNDNDYPLMRSSEMYLIEAEGLARAGQISQAQDVLFEFVSHRNPNYVKTIKTGDEFIDEVYFQRRIELWGEGFSYVDHKRLNKGIIRDYSNTNHNVDARMNFDPGASVLKYRIPDSEIKYNKGITEKDNNPT